MITEDPRAVALRQTCERLRDAANLRFVLLVGPRGKPFARAGEQGFISEFLAQEELAGLMGDGSVQRALTERKFAVKPSREGGSNVYVQNLDGGALLVMGFDEESSLAHVRLQAMRFEDDLERLLGQKPPPTLH